MAHAAMGRCESLLDIRGLAVSFGRGGESVRVVDRVSLRIPPGKTVALVGESGCGKSVTALSILQLLPPPGRVDSGEILFYDSRCLEPSDPESSRVRSTAVDSEKSSPKTHDVRVSAQAKACGSEGTLGLCCQADAVVDLLQLTDDAVRRVRGNRIAMVFQEPMTSLNPVLSIGEQIVEVLELHRNLKGRAARAEAIELLSKVGIADPKRRVRDFPHHMSGGMRQRVMIAMALACEPALLIADEPTTALDVTVQRQILDLLAALQTETGMSVLLITHDLGVVAQHADDVYVMYAGRIVEHATVAALFENPLHPYTQGLLRCTPRLDAQTDRLHVIPGQVPDPANMPGGCRFHPRCYLTRERANETDRTTVALAATESLVLGRCIEHRDTEPGGAPELRRVNADHIVACWEC